MEVEFLEANTCAVCLTESTNLLTVGFDEKQGPTIGPILVKHLWFQPEDLYSKNICDECWAQVHQFHIFYITAEKAHADLKVAVGAGDLVGSFKAEPTSYSSELHETYMLQVEQTESISLKTEESENLPVKTVAVDQEEQNTPNEALEFEYEPEDDDKELSDYEPQESKSDTESSDECNSDSEQTKKSPKKVRKKQPTKQSPKNLVRNYNKPAEQTEAEDKKISEHCKLQCAECGISSQRFADYKQHARKAHQITHPVVICCGRRFNKRIKLYEHVASQMDPDAFRCTVCEKSYSNSLNLRLHMLRHAPPDARDHKCDKCERSFAKRYQLNAHLQTHVPEEERKFVCSSCKKTFSTSSQLNVHIRTKHMPAELYICEVCAKNFKTRSQFEKHRQEHNESYQEIRLQCKICSKWMKNASSLRKHVLRHDGEGEVHECELCGKRAPNSLALQSHISFVHKKDKLFQCTLCPKAFKRQFTLVEHMTTHTGEVLYQCSFCSKNFNSSANMHAHKKKVHPQEWEQGKRMSELPFSGMTGAEYLRSDS